MVHDLFLIEFRDEGEYACCIACEEDEIRWVGRKAWDFGVGDVFNRIGAAGVFCQCVI